MITKKKSKAARLGALALALTLVTTCLMGGTMARYVSEVTGSATATVAAWSFKANGESTEKFEIDLGSTANRQAYDSGIMEGVIAPGTSGSFDIVIDGSGSEVGVDYIMAFDATSINDKKIDLPADLTFTVDNGEGATAYKMGDPVEGTIAYNAADMKKTLKVTWSWAFDENDTKDDKTNDNTYANEDWTLDITVTGKQTTLKPATP